MEVLVVDGRGGGMGKSLIEELKTIAQQLNIVACGTNKEAAEAMAKAGASRFAWGEQALLPLAARADIIAGPIGIVMAGSLQGEITPQIAMAIAVSAAHKVLIPVNRCRTTVAGTQDKPLKQHIADAALLIKNFY